MFKVRQRKANISVWQPRWHDRKVLVAQYKVKKGMNIIKITEGAAQGKYQMSEVAIRSYPLETNGAILCYALPLEKLERIE